VTKERATLIFGLVLVLTIAALEWNTDGLIGRTSTMGTPDSPLKQAIERGMQPGGDLSDEVYALDECKVETAAEAEAIVTALRTLIAGATEVEDDGISTLVGLFQDVAAKEAFDVLAADGMDLLVEHFNGVFPTAGEDDEYDLLFMLKIMVLYKDERTVDLIVRTARKSDGPDGFLWSVIFDALRDDHPLWRPVCEGLRDPLPRGFICMAYLDLVNGYAIRGKLDDHPFDTPAGKPKLREWLTGDDPAYYSYARSAATAVPFISEPERSEFLALALDHADVSVQMTGAWASAHAGRDAGLKLLVRWAEDPRHSYFACEHLSDLGREDLIPESTKAPDFQAMAEMCVWLTHPHEFGRAPDAIELFDTRELFWPPTNDRRRLWLFKYTYKGDPGEDDEIGIGLVGSVTFALFSEGTADKTPEGVYGLHCCWELQCNEDPRAPEERDGRIGWQIVLDHQ
jgi:hypothetical protein